MAENKKTFIFYSDWINMVQEMPDIDAGQLLKHVLSYVNDDNPTTDNILVKVVFGHMKPMLKDDLIKWADIRNKRKEYGKKGGQANAKQKLAKAKQVEAVNDNVNVNVNVNDNKKKESELNIFPTFNDFWEQYNKKSGDKRNSEKKWNRLDQKTKEHIIHHVRIYTQSTPDKQFRKNPETYLNQKHWENEILKNEENGRGNNIETVQKYIDIISEQGN